ncbi:MAG: branched-chain amino acid transaminase [Epsilonproteobacteria bacterium]|nr:branched-chain amino acid transaminase [Campylobacterota bacterium]OIO17922.1 MAG: branched chain amino acid aminotransferase [Helicobacteraceae bacterium CG1_02_36_14]PIP09328.1 MAG: branched chain amino acid aminotransferase [Sulfurimonas sp. CG23_combo_of_CG06-09_8_20_14_all_36_33]PIS24381.1 MAG: branched chain amino acid aminotransferase [Sulfurimonas sp. CG08_land_8_20_14_0_20_36_33]PIU34466.1 MAG: branched chain amino acid aminotransferase [Sulfurimonas sp. CG07_land_8_20_14_0_80_36_56
MEAAKYIWMNGKFVSWDDAKVHVLTHTIHYGNGVIEGTKAYRTERGYAIFRLNDHTKRLKESAKMTLIDIPFSVEELNQAQIDLIRKNEFDGDNVYLRPFAFLGYGVMGIYHKNVPVETAIAAWEWGAYLGEEGMKKGIKLKIVSMTRPANTSNMGKAKATGNYLNSQMAKYEAIDCGYDEALLLDDQGYVAEASGASFFMVRNGELITPPSDNALESITQKTVIEMAQNMGINVVRRRITREEIYIADEAFLTGTAAEITPVRLIDARVIGNGARGEMTEKIQSAYFDIVFGRNREYEHYLTYVN